MQIQMNKATSSAVNDEVTPNIETKWRTCRCGKVFLVRVHPLESPKYAFFTQKEFSKQSLHNQILVKAMFKLCLRSIFQQNIKHQT